MISRSATVGRPLIASDELRELLGATGSRTTTEDSLTLLDCRFDLMDPAAASAGYRAGHLPGAVPLDLARDLSGPVRPDGHGGRHPLPTARTFVAALRRAGVRSGVPVIAYDARMEGGAARLWWLARELGLTDVRVLDGGLAAWRGPLVAGDVPKVAPGDVVIPTGIAPQAPLGGDGARVRWSEDLLAPPSGRLLIDVRAEGRFRGEQEPMDPVAGHVPGARNVPNVDRAGAPPSDEVLRELADHPGELVVSCGSGVSACVLLVRLAALGRDDALLYPGSWSDWTCRGLPVERG
jgi:thiosulfate/3-mercaptopyruvate sulfurtransferase